MYYPCSDLCFSSLFSHMQKSRFSHNEAHTKYDDSCIPGAYVTDVSPDYGSLGGETRITISGGGKDIPLKALHAFCNIIYCVFTAIEFMFKNRN